MKQHFETCRKIILGNHLTGRLGRKDLMRWTGIQRGLCDSEQEPPRLGHNWFM